MLGIVKVDKGNVECGEEEEDRRGLHACENVECIEIS
jgi:hypothetical protein